MSHAVCQPELLDYCASLPPRSVSYTERDAGCVYDTVVRGIRKFRDDCVFEFGGGYGVSTRAMSLAVRDAVPEWPAERCISVERDPARHAYVRRALDGRGTLWPVDLTRATDCLQGLRFGALIIDADHSAECAAYYLEELVPRVRRGGHIVLHDMTPRSQKGAEMAAVLRYAVDHELDTVHYTPVGEASVPLPGASQTVHNCCWVLEVPRDGG